VAKSASTGQNAHRSMPCPWILPNNTCTPSLRVTRARSLTHEHLYVSTATMRFVTTPTHNWLREAACKCTRRFLVSSPYVGSLFVRLSEDLASGVHKTLVTRTDLRDFALGASDVDALCDLASQQTTILSLPRLHAKVYVIDQKRALITSANATEGGMRRNWECGVSIEGARQVNRIAKLVLSGFGAEETLQAWTFDELVNLRGPVRALRDRMPSVRRLPELDAAQLPVIKLNRKAQTALLNGLAGWTQLTLEGVLTQAQDLFTLDALFGTCAPIAAERFPRNRHVRPKLRQQLQRLRDLGLVEFLGGAMYRRTVQP